MDKRSPPVSLCITITWSPQTLHSSGMLGCLTATLLFYIKHSFLALAQTCAEISVVTLKVTFDMPDIKVWFGIEKGADAWKR